MVYETVSRLLVLTSTNLSSKLWIDERRLVRRFSYSILRILTGFVLAHTVSLCPTFAASQENSSSVPVVLESVDVRPTVEGAVIEIKASQPFVFVTYTLSDPVRLVVDPMGVSLQTTLPADTALEKSIIRGWHLFRSQADDPNQGVDYLVFDLAGPAEHLMEPTDGKLVLRVRLKNPANPEKFEVRNPGFGFRTLAAPPPALRPEEEEFQLGVEPEKVPAQSPVLVPMAAPPAGSPLWSLESVLEFGLSRHRPIQVAREEVQLAEMKLREARRAFYPGVTLKYSWTQGIASNVGFTEVTEGVQVEQPLYYSHRLQDAYRQAVVNLQVSEKRQSKVRADFSLEIAQAYYQLVGAQAGLETQRGFLEETQKFFDQVKARFEKGFLTRMEVLNVESQVNQARFQRATAENDLQLARLKFLQRVKLEPTAVADVPAQFPPIVKNEVDLEEAFQLANQYRPEVQLNTLLVEFNELEIRVAKKKSGLKVDLSGFYGSSGSAFETERLSLGNDYFIGVKATQALGPHGLSMSATDTHTSPRLGQTTRTDSKVYSAELAIANQLQGMSEVQQARVGLEKAKNDLEDAKALIYQEVQEAYISYNKARLQLEYAKQKVEFREEQLKILKAQSSLNEILPSQVLEAMMRLNDDRASQIQAQTNYYVALVKLNKAVGLPSHYQ